MGVAAGLGLRPRDVDTVAYAALLHDIGRISLNEPSVLRMSFTDNDIAKGGSEIVGETSYLTEVSEVVLRQYELDLVRGIERQISELQPAVIYTHHAGDVNVGPCRDRACRGRCHPSDARPSGSRVSTNSRRSVRPSGVRGGTRPLSQTISWSWSPPSRASGTLLRL